jgi:outer membrane protein TolC
VRRPSTFFVAVSIAVSATTPVLAESEPTRLSLAEAIALAEQQAPALTRAHAQVDRARLASLRAQLDRVAVSVDASVAELYNKSNIGGPAPDVGPASPDIVLGLSALTGSVEVPLFSGFRVTRTIERAGHVETAAGFDARAERLALAASVTRAYWAVRRLQVLAEARRASLERLAQSEEVVRARVKSGLSPPIDANRAAQRRLALEAEIAGLAAQEREETAALGALLGMPSDPALSDPLVAFDPSRVDGGADEGGDPHPAVRAAEARRWAQATATDVLRAGYWPQLSLFALGQYGNNPSRAGIGARQLHISPNPVAGVVGDVQAGLRLTLNIFDGLRTTQAVQDAEHLERIAAADVQAVSRDVDRATRVARARARGLVERRAVLLRARDVAQDNLAIVERSYQNGDALFVDLLDANLAAADTEREIADIDAQLTLAALELQLARGRVPGDPS